MTGRATSNRLFTPADVDEFVAWYESQTGGLDLVGIAAWWRARIAGHHDRTLFSMTDAAGGAMVPDGTPWSKP